MENPDINTTEMVNEIKESISERNNLVLELKKQYPIDDFVVYNEFTLQEKLEHLPTKIIEFQDHMNREDALLKELEKQQNVLMGKLYDHYRFNFDKRLTGQEIKEYYIPKDTRMLAFDKIIRKQRWIVDYFEGCTKALDKMSWIVKDFLKTIKSGI